MPYRRRHPSYKIQAYKFGAAILVLLVVAMVSMIVAAGDHESNSLQPPVQQAQFPPAQPARESPPG